MKVDKLRACINAMDYRIFQLRVRREFSQESIGKIVGLGQVQVSRLLKQIYAKALRIGQEIDAVG